MSSEKRDSSSVIVFGLLLVIFIACFGTYSRIQHYSEFGVTVKKEEFFREHITRLKLKCFDKTLPPLVRFEMLKNLERDYLKYLAQIAPKEDFDLKKDLVEIRAGLIAVCLELGKIKEAEEYLASENFRGIDEKERKYFENKIQYLKENPTKEMEREALFNQLIEERNQRIDAEFEKESQEKHSTEKK